MQTILLVDDEPEQLRSLGIGLRSKGYATVEAADGRSALSLLQSNPAPIDFVVTDFSMPGMSGLELLKEAKLRNSGLPVILLTAFGIKALVIEALRQQCNGFLEKPFQLEALVAEIERINGVQSRSPRPDAAWRL